MTPSPSTQRQTRKYRLRTLERRRQFLLRKMSEQRWPRVIYRRMQSEEAALRWALLELNDGRLPEVPEEEDWFASVEGEER